MRENTEMVILEGRRQSIEIDVQVDGKAVSSKESIEYLGVTFGRNFRMKDQKITH